MSLVDLYMYDGVPVTQAIYARPAKSGAYLDVDASARCGKPRYAWYSTRDRSWGLLAESPRRAWIDYSRGLAVRGGARWFRGLTERVK